MHILPVRHSSEGDNHFGVRVSVIGSIKDWSYIIAHRRFQVTPLYRIDSTLILKGKKRVLTHWIIVIPNTETVGLQASGKTDCTAVLQNDTKSHGHAVD